MSNGPSGRPARPEDRRWLELVESVVHDLRTPLATLSGYLELATLDPAGLGDRQREQLAYASQAARELARQIEAAQLVARFQAGAVELRVAERPLAAVAESALIRLGEPERGRLAWRRREAGAVRCDSGLLGRAIAGLVERALLRSGDDGTVELVVERTGDGTGGTGPSRLRFAALDRGSPIATAEVEELFGSAAPREGRRRSPKLDLSLARLVAEAHGGVAGAHSAEGETALWIELPGA